MLSKNQIKHIHSLRLRKFREESGRFTAEGNKLVMDLLESRFRISGIYALREWIDANSYAINRKNVPVFEINSAEMDRISQLSTPSPVFAVFEIPTPVAPPAGIDLGWSLALDDIRDPGNMGTIIRIADWFGVEVVLCSETCVDLYNPKVVQATMGSIARVKVIYCNLRNVLKEYVKSGEGQIYGAFLEGNSIYNDDLIKPGIVLIGNESRGISCELEQLVTRKIFIPSYGDAKGGKAESLNASVAAAIICAEFRRKMI
ncbi:MAG: RNA methyltransferase [Bacteroidota bacterium]